jgi:hypothetical protein
MTKKMGMPTMDNHIALSNNKGVENGCSKH